MSDQTVTDPEAPVEWVAHATIVYLGPVAPHWDIRRDWGDEQLLDEFRTRVNARLVLLPPHDPQYKRNRERVRRDGEAHGIEVAWDLGDDDYYASS